MTTPATKLMDYMGAICGGGPLVGLYVTNAFTIGMQFALAQPDFARAYVDWSKAHVVNGEGFPDMIAAGMDVELIAFIGPIPEAGS